MGQIELYTYNGKMIKPKTDAITFNTMITQSGILHGCSITYVGTNQIRIGYGEGIIKGRRFYIEEQTMAVELSDSGEKPGRIYIRMDLSNAEKPIDILSITAASLPDLEKDEEVNYTSGIYEIEIATYTASETMLSDVTATYITVNGADILDTMEEIMANTDPNKCAGALAVKELGSSLVNAGSAKYNAETDSLDIYYNGELVGSLRCGFKGFNVLKTLNSDWTLTSDSNSKATGLTTTITESNAKFVTTWSIGAMNTYFAYIRYAKESIDLTNLSTIKFVASFSGSGGGINFGISLVNKNTGARTTVFNKNTGSAYSASCNENIDITGYSGEYYIELFTNSSSNPYPSITVTSLYLE